MSKAWAGGTTGHWRRVRTTVLDRDGRLCQIKMPGTWVTRTGETRSCLIVADCVHHTLGKGVTGDDPDYCVAACTPCNLKVGDPTADADPPPRKATKW